MTNCPSCKLPVASDALACSNCGTSLDDTSLPTEAMPPAGKREASRLNSPNQQSMHFLNSADGARFAPGTMLTERYRIVTLLGRGGMGEVYKAEDLKLKQIVALKFLPDAVATDSVALARFHNEVRITRQISHPNVCRVYDIGEVDGRHFLSMEFIDGEDLSSLLRRIGRLPGDKATEIARQICAGLAAAHNNGVLHRDLKPANVMIDGRGKARITDFGVAVATGELSSHEVIAGTPGYMAPEQLSGKEVTISSDLYALGLVLYELFTGKRVFEANSFHDLIKLHQSSSPTSPSNHVKNLDPLVERVILRCLEKDPGRRPASAIQVAAALPGGDPLTAALAAGETPSPEMVAASGEKTGLRPAIALGMLAAIIIGLTMTVFVGRKVDWRAEVLQKNSPEVLTRKAQETIQKLGYTDQPTDTASGLSYDDEYQTFVERNDNIANRWSRFTMTQPSPIYFWHRESPRYLEYNGIDDTASEDDPPPLVSGMVNVRLDPLGHLILFNAVPPQVAPATGTAAAPNWDPLFGAAGLEETQFTPTAPTWLPLAGFDARAAWTGTYPGQPEIPLRIEAAAWRGQPVYFELIAPWTRPARVQDYQPTAGRRIKTIFAVTLILSLLFGAVLLARYNFRLGRGDRRGAFRLALFFFAVALLSWLFNSSHVPTIGELRVFFFVGVSQTLVFASFLWLLYLALEPFVRRRWPNTIISWSRVLSGNWRDPLVGRDVLVGVLLGIGSTLVRMFEGLVYMWRGVNPSSADRLDVWLGIRYFIGHGLLTHVYQAIALASFLFLMLFILRVLARREWLAAAIFVTIWTLLIALGSSDPILSTPFLGLFYALAVIAMLRFGLVTVATGIFVAELLRSVPLTTNFSAWYASTELLALVAVLALAAFACRTSLGGQKLFDEALLERTLLAK